MSAKSQSGSPKLKKPQESGTGKVKVKNQKGKSGKKQVPEEAPMPSLRDFEVKIVDSLNRLGNQTFALSPFSQYFDNWLMNLKQVTYEFESNPNVKADEIFAKEKSQIFLDVERSLAENRLQESNLAEPKSALSENNHRLADLDAEYATKNRDIDGKRNLDIQILTHRIHDIETESEIHKGKATKGFNPFAKKTAKQKLAITNQNLTAAKNELEITLQNFSVEQEKLHDDYEKRKQEVTVKIESLQKEIEKFETDNSLDARQTACNALVAAIKTLIQRTQTTTN